MMVEQLGDGTRGMRLLGKWQHRFSTREESLQAWKQALVYLGHVISAQSSMQMSPALVLMCIRLFRGACLPVCPEPDPHLWTLDDLPKLTVSFSALTPGLPFLSFLEHGWLESRNLPLQGI